MTTIDLALLETLTLSKGSHDNREDGVCAMELVAWMAGEPHSDHPVCTCPVIAAFGRSWNDGLPTDADRDRLLKPLLPLVIGTRTTAADEETRSWLAFDWLARVQTPAWLRLAGLSEEAQLLEATARVVDAATCELARLALGRGYECAAAARAAARDAARDAAWAAAGAAARAAARAAAGAAAGAAARDAARDAAGVAAGAAAGAAARDAARDAAWAAAGAAARAAARAAAKKALLPTVAALQDSASELVRAMCAVGRDKEGQ